MTAPEAKAPAAAAVRERMPVSVEAAREALGRLVAPRAGWRTPAAALAAALEDDIPALDAPCANVLIRLRVLLAVLREHAGLVTVGAAPGRSPFDAWAREFSEGFESGLVPWSRAWAVDRIPMTISMAREVVSGR